MNRGDADVDDLCGKYHAVSVEVVTVDKPHIDPAQEISGWGETGHVSIVTGKATEIIVKREGKHQFGLRILEDGSVILTSYDSLLTPQLWDRNLKFTNERPWGNKNV